MTTFQLTGAAAAVLILSACGSDEPVNNAAGPDLNAAAGVPLGNDASAMEIVGNQGGSLAVPEPAEGNGSALSRSNNSAPRERGEGPGQAQVAPPPPPDLGSNERAPGGDRGGNAALGNVSGT